MCGGHLERANSFPCNQGIFFFFLNLENEKDRALLLLERRKPEVS